MLLSNSTLIGHIRYPVYYSYLVLKFDAGYTLSNYFGRAIRTSEHGGRVRGVGPGYTLSNYFGRSSRLTQT